MKTKIKKEVEVTLLLNTKEAIWLKILVQNPINCNYEDESETDKNMRGRFWIALKEVSLT